MGSVVVGEPSNFPGTYTCSVHVLSQLMQDERGETALFAACSQGCYDPAALLIEFGADVNYLNKVRPFHGEHGRMVCSVYSKVGLLCMYMVIIV